jgi:hypothetical protein
VEAQSVANVLSGTVKLWREEGKIYIYMCIDMRV